jgi:hypothetical protein
MNSPSGSAFPISNDGSDGEFIANLSNFRYRARAESAQPGPFDCEDSDHVQLFGPAPMGVQAQYRDLLWYHLDYTMLFSGGGACPSRTGRGPVQPSARSTLAGSRPSESTRGEWPLHDSSSGHDSGDRDSRASPCTHPAASRGVAEAHPRLASALVARISRLSRPGVSMTLFALP